MAKRFFLVAFIVVSALLVGCGVSVEGQGGTGQPPPAATAVPQPTTPPSGGAPAATAVPRAAAAPTPDSDGRCHAFHDYPFVTQPEVATSGTAIQVEYWNPGDRHPPEGPVERETFMMAHGEAPGARFLVTQRGREGHVWEYKGDCTEEYLMTQMRESQQRRIAGHVNNRGYVPWRETGLFQPAAPPS